MRSFLRRIRDLYPNLPQAIKKVLISRETLEKVLGLVRRFMPYGGLPHKMQEMIDQALTKRVSAGQVALVEIEGLKKRILRVLVRYQKALAKNDPSQLRYL